MANSSSSSSTLAPGFRFHPTDEELIIYYLKRKLLNRPLLIDAISSVNLYQLEPWDLPPLAKLQTKDQQWFFFCPLDRKNNCNQPRTNRATPRGYWKTTGKDREVVRRGDLKTVVGMKKTLVYHCGRAPRGNRTKWVMHEYRLLDEKLVNNGVCLDGLVVCRIFEKKGAGHQIGAQYGAPVTEEESEEEKDEQEKGKEEEELIQVQIQKGKIGNPIYPQLANSNEDINGANIAQIHQEPDIFNGLDSISNQELNINTFFEMNDLSTNLTTNLLNYPSALNSDILPGPDSFFDSLDEFNFNDQTDEFNFNNQTDKFNFNNQTDDQIFSNQNQNFGDEFSTFFDAVDSNSLGDNHSNNNNSGLDDILQNYEGMNGNYTENVEISNTQDLIPNPVPYSPLSEHLISLLDSYSSPPAFASELKPSKVNASSASHKKSKSTKVNSVVSRVLRGVLCVAIVLTAGCKLAICIGAR
ncbi:hypothetical protein LUZ60_015117 [Juncus effusus]|nr:hypothetical protein LUZ60_015117 [Juncus effusus]